MFQVQLRDSLEVSPRVSFGNKNLSSRGLFTLLGQLGHFPLDIHIVGPSGCTHSDIPGERESHSDSPSLMWNFHRIAFCSQSTVFP